MHQILFVANISDARYTWVLVSSHAQWNYETHHPINSSSFHKKNNSSS
jgi:hypothetical protein